MNGTSNTDYDEVVRGIEFGTLAEQKDETHYDRRGDSGKGRISFPKNKLYGRDVELQKLHSWYTSLQSNDDSSVHVFLGGYSGTGKSALVEEFIKEIVSKRNDRGKHTCSISGKFGQLKAGRPFGALSHALDQYVVGLALKLSKRDLEQLTVSLAEVDITLDSEDATLLSDVLMPRFKDFLEKQSLDSSAKRKSERRKQEESFTRQVLCTVRYDSKRRGRRDKARDTFSKSVPSSLSCEVNFEFDVNVRYDMNVIKYAFQNFIKALAVYCKPLIFFIDDLQWADDASFQLLTGLLKDKSLKHVFFIGAFRVNEVDECHQLTKLMNDVEAENGLEVKKLDLFNLSPSSTSSFIADSIDREADDITLIADVIYTKTLGNIFFVKQALEELVRKNALYYDVICYQWQFGDVTRVDLENFLSADVVEMVLSKLKTLPKSLQTALALAAYTKGMFELDLLESLLASKKVGLEPGSLQKMMDLACSEGLLVRANSPALSAAERRSCYNFSHEANREAACALVPAGDERNQFILCISKVLVARGSPDKDDWMLFAAASHLNALPVSLTDPIELAELNLTVGKIACSKGAFSDAAVFLRAGVGSLNPDSCWEGNYALSLELKNCLMDAEQVLGNVDKVLEITGEICQKAKNLSDKSRAHVCYLEAFDHKNNRDHGQTAVKSLDILQEYGIHMPKSPTKIQAVFEKLSLEVARRNCSWDSLAQFPLATDLEMIASMKLAAMALMFANLGKQQKNYKLNRLADMLGERILRVAISNQVITKDMAFLFGSVGVNLRGRGKYVEAVEIANAGISMMERFPEERGTEFLKAKVAVLSIGCLSMNFRDSMDIYWDLQKKLYAKNEITLTIDVGLAAIFGYLSSSLRLEAFLESKLLSFEELGRNVGESVSTAPFGVLRQCLYNLEGGRKASSNPVELKGPAFDENNIQSQVEGVAEEVTMQHISIARLMLAVMYGDEEVMQQMLDRLDKFPISDFILQRQHLRLTYTGFAALMLSGKSAKYKKWAKISMKFFGKLARFGSANGRPVYACMKAIYKPSVPAFEEAIQQCAIEGIINLSALMNERCGLLLLEQDNKNSEVAGKDHLRCALHLYNDWGACGKALQLKTQHTFLA